MTGKGKEWGEGTVAEERDAGGTVGKEMIINNSYKALFSNQLNSLRWTNTTKTALTYISNIQNLKYCSLPLSSIKQ